MQQNFSCGAILLLIPVGIEVPCQPPPAPPSLAQQTPRPRVAHPPEGGPLGSPQEPPIHSAFTSSEFHISPLGNLETRMLLGKTPWSRKQLVHLGVGGSNQEVKALQRCLWSWYLNLLLICSIKLVEWNQQRIARLDAKGSTKTIGTSEGRILVLGMLLTATKRPLCPRPSGRGTTGVSWARPKTQKVQ